MVNWPKQRAWGWYATLLRTPWLCIKILRFRPHNYLSLQMHKHRTEVWIFLRGAGKIFLAPYEPEEPPIRVRRIHPVSFGTIWKVPKRYWHRFTALSKPVYVLEIQFGNKVTEEDIERR